MGRFGRVVVGIQNFSNIIVYFYLARVLLIKWKVLLKTGLLTLIATNIYWVLLNSRLILNTFTYTNIFNSHSVPNKVDVIFLFSSSISKMLFHGTLRLTPSLPYDFMPKGTFLQRYLKCHTQKGFNALFPTSDSTSLLHSFFLST